jgi:hypothetical protein
LFREKIQNNQVYAAEDTLHSSSLDELLSSSSSLDSSSSNMAPAPLKAGSVGASAFLGTSSGSM